jgi:hypothetical protein
MKAKPRITGIILLACLLVLMTWLGLFVLGWYTRHPDEGPLYAGKSLYNCGLAISDGRKQSHPDLMKLLEADKNNIIPIAISWTRARSSLAYRVYSRSTYIWYGKNDFLNQAYDYGIPAHMYRYSGATLLGELALDIPEARKALEKMATDTEIEIADLERETARAFLGLPKLSRDR